MKKVFVAISALLAVASSQGIAQGASGSARNATKPAPRAGDMQAREQTADQQVQHVLNRLAYGARPGDVQAVRTMGVDAWIDRQLHPEKIPDVEADRLVAQFTTLGKTGEELMAQYPPAVVLKQQLKNATAADSAKVRAMGRESFAFLGEVSSARVARAVMSERQLQEVMVDFWENHFNVFAGKDRTRYFLPEYDARVIRPNALGKFRDLLGAVAKSSAMLYYLDNWQSMADSGRPVRLPNGRMVAEAPRGMMGQGRKRGLNENYARELMELHTLGVDGGYTQQDVIQVARALTGWTIERGPNGGGFLFRPVMHDAGEKTILGVRFPAGRGIEDGEQVLDMLAKHPKTAHFIAFKLARRFVSDTPPAALVDRAAATFTRTNGDIREVVRTIVTSPEFFATSAYRAKVKSPYEVVVSTLRALGSTPDATPRIAQLVTRLGQPIFGHQAPDGYPEVGDPWMNTGAILNRINFGLAVASNRIPGVRLDSWPAAQTLANLPREQQVDGVIRELFGGAVSPDTRQVLLTGTNPFLKNERAMAGDTLFSTTVSSNDAMSDMKGDMKGAGNSDQKLRRDRKNAGRDRASRQANERQLKAAGREAVKPGSGNTLASAVGTIPDLRGLAQIVGLALGAPEFQRR